MGLEEQDARLHPHGHSVGWPFVTGHPPLLSAADYTTRGYRWFDYYEEKAKSHAGTEATKGLKSLGEIQKEKGLPLLPENNVKAEQTVKLKKHPHEVRGGSWAK